MDSRYTPSHGHHGDSHEYHVFHVEFERVEIPFIIALWIFVSSLAKIGKKVLDIVLHRLNFVLTKNHDQPVAYKSG